MVVGVGADSEVASRLDMNPDDNPDPNMTGCLWSGSSLGAGHAAIGLQLLMCLARRSRTAGVVKVRDQE